MRPSFFICWKEVSITDPETGAPADPGTPGLVTITDLANLDSCIRIATRDLGIQSEDPGATSRFTLLGRDPAGNEEDAETDPALLMHMKALGYTE